MPANHNKSLKKYLYGLVGTHRQAELTGNAALLVEGNGHAVAVGHRQRLGGTGAGAGGAVNTALFVPAHFFGERFHPHPQFHEKGHGLSQPLVADGIINTAFKVTYSDTSIVT